MNPKCLDVNICINCPYPDLQQTSMYTHANAYACVLGHTREYDLQCWVIKNVKLYLCPNLLLSNYITYICFQGPVKNILSMLRSYFQRTIDACCNCMLVCYSAQQGSSLCSGHLPFFLLFASTSCVCLGKMACINPSSWLFWINTAIFSKSNASIY